MIEQINLTNFQGHQDSEFKLHPGINVITGDSDSGKSSVIRALYWAIKNRPTGGADVYRNRHADPKDIISVTLLLHNYTPGEGYSPDYTALVTRYRRGLENGYDVMGDILKAIRTDVPAEVISLLNISDHNIQPQHDSYFLLADSPGDVSRQLNDVCGLVIIDNCLATANLLISRNGQDTKTSEQAIQQTQADIEAYNDLGGREMALGRLERKQDHLVATRGQIEHLTDLIGTKEALESDMESIDYVLEAKPEVDALQEKVKELQAVWRQREVLHGLIKERTRLDKELDRTDATLGELEASLHSLMDGLDVCPICKREMPQ